VITVGLHFKWYTLFIKHFVHPAEPQLLEGEFALIAFKTSSSASQEIRRISLTMGRQFKVVRGTVSVFFCKQKTNFVV
jgi:hypothetical protein